MIEIGFENDEQILAAEAEIKGIVLRDTILRIFTNKRIITIDASAKGQAIVNVFNRAKDNYKYKLVSLAGAFDAKGLVYFFCYYTKLSSSSEINLQSD